ncbi:hypothetical protein F5Y01DRAFT_1945 [Xylaria sp. FL0043]|nr:hypothetical protein F5Y01DRAFT_1945 [Xylaria sp. FL0043]
MAQKDLFPLKNVGTFFLLFLHCAICMGSLARRDQLDTSRSSRSLRSQQHNESCMERKMVYDHSDMINSTISVQ